MSENFMNLPSGSGQSETNQKLQQIADSLGVTTDALNSAVNLANTAGNNANAKIVDVENRFNTLTTAQQQASEVVDARKGKASLKAKIDEMDTTVETHKADNMSHGLTTNKTIYVATTGSDSTGDGSISKPYATIQKAVDMCTSVPSKFINTISIGTGSFVGATISNKFVRLISANNDNPTITTTLNLINSNLTFDSAFTFLTSSGYGMSTMASTVIFNATGCVFSGVNGVSANDSSKISTKWNVNVTFINCTYAIQSNYLSEVFIYVIKGSSNTTGLRCDGGIIKYNVNTMTATTLTATMSGGRIYTGAQTSIPNY